MDEQQSSTGVRLKRIRKVSRVFKYFFLLLFVVYAAFAASIWFLPIKGNEVRADFGTANYSPSNTTTNTADLSAGAHETISLSLRVGVANDDHLAKQKAERPRPNFMWTVRPLGYLSSLYIAFGFWIIYRLFHFFEMGLIFAAETVRCLKQVGIWLLGYWAWNNFIELTDWFTQNPAFVDLRFDLCFAGGFLVLLISWLMDEGRKLQEEQSLTV